MTALFRSLTLVVVLVASASTISCVSSKVTGAIGKPLDSDSLAAIKPGETGLREILEWFGPPNQIVDGTQTILDPEHLTTSWGAIKTRTLSSRDGEVLLLYGTRHQAHSWDTSHLGPLTYRKERHALRANEVMIVLRKHDHTVIGVMAREDDS